MPFAGEVELDESYFGARRKTSASRSALPRRRLTSTMTLTTYALDGTIVDRVTLTPANEGEEVAT